MRNARNGVDDDQPTAGAATDPLAADGPQTEDRPTLASPEVPEASMDLAPEHRGDDGEFGRNDGYAGD